MLTQTRARVRIVRLQDCDEPKRASGVSDVSHPVRIEMGATGFGSEAS
jgi:hypothetical protein